MEIEQSNCRLHFTLRFHSLLSSLVTSALQSPCFQLHYIIPMNCAATFCQFSAQMPGVLRFKEPQYEQYGLNEYRWIEVHTCRVISFCFIKLDSSGAFSSSDKPRRVTLPNPEKKGRTYFLSLKDCPQIFYLMLKTWQLFPYPRGSEPTIPSPDLAARHASTQEII